MIGFCCDKLEFASAGLPNVSCHAGFYECAMAVWENVREKVVALLAEERRREWKVVCTGHSMGVFLAASIFMIERGLPRYFALFVVAYVDISSTACANL